MSKENEPYPASCPACSAPSGWPYAAGTCDRADVIVVKLRCKACGYVWMVDAPKQTRFLERAREPQPRFAVIDAGFGARGSLQRP
jgi:hypothetical protein